MRPDRDGAQIGGRVVVSSAVVPRCAIAQEERLVCGVAGRVTTVRRARGDQAGHREEQVARVHIAVVVGLEHPLDL
jgi:hypothetical protein